MTNSNYLKSTLLALLFSCCCIVNSLHAQVISNTEDTCYTEGQAPIVIHPNFTLVGGSQYGNGYIEFDITNSNAFDQLAMFSDPNPNAVGAISVMGNAVLIGNGTGTDIIGSIDAVQNGMNGNDLRINFSSNFTNPSFEMGLMGWTVSDTRVDLGDTGIAGFVTPETGTYPGNTTNQDNNVPQFFSYSHALDNSQSTDGNTSLRLFNNGTTRFGCDVVHGGYAHSDVFQAQAGDMLRFDWRAINGSDWYDVFGYLLNVNTGATTITLDQFGASSAWTTQSVNVPTTGDYRFVFVSGTYDRTCGLAAGASLYIDNFEVFGDNVNDMIISSIAQHVTYEQSCAMSTDTRDLTVTVENGDASDMASVMSEIAIKAIAPVITCPSTVMESNIMGTCMSGPVTFMATATDDCPVTFSYSPASGSSFPIGTTTVTATATDSYGESSTCTFEVVVSDSDPPVFTSCNAGFTIDVFTNECETSVLWPVPEATDCSGDVTITQISGIAQGSIQDTGSYEIMYEATDASGNADTCTFTIMVIDTEDPVIVNCPFEQQTILADEDCMASLPDYTLEFQAMDNCELSWTQDPPAMTMLEGGTLDTVTVTATDDAGNMSSCSFEVFVVDTVAPELTCPADINQSVDPGMCGAVIEFDDPEPMDNCDLDLGGGGGGMPFNFSTGGATGRLGPTQGQLDAAYAGTNLDGNVTSMAGIQLWTVPATGLYQIQAFGAQGGDVGGLGASISGEFNLTAGEVLQILVGQAGSTMDNSHGSGGGGSFVVTQIGNNPLVVAGGGGGHGKGIPGINGFSDGAVGTAGQSPTNVGGGFGDGPGGINGGGGAAASGTNGGTATTNGDPSSGSTWASGGGGFLTNGGNYRNNTLQGGQAFVNGGVGGEAGPGTNAPGGFGGGGGAGDRGAGGGGYSGGGGATDNNEGGGGGGSFNGGTNPMAMAGVNMGDGQVIITPLTVDMSQAGLRQVAGLPSGSMFPVGTTTNIFEFSDAQGSTDTCSFTITITDDEDPTISCTGLTTAIGSSTGGDGECYAQYGWTIPTPMDNCGLQSYTVRYTNPDGTIDGPHPAYVFDPNNGGNTSGGLDTANRNFEVGMTTVTYFVEDFAGNVASCSFTVTVTDDERPSFDYCPNDFIVSNSIDQCGGVVMWFDPQAEDNCGDVTVARLDAGPAQGTQWDVGTYTVTYIATDGTTVPDTCEFMVTVTDDQDPMILCPSNTVVAEADADMCNWTSGPQVDPNFSDDNCDFTITHEITGATSVAAGTAGSAMGTVFNLGVSTVCYTITEDANGMQVDSCCFDVEVVDVTAPIVECPSDTVIYAPDTACLALYEYEVTAADSCDGESGPVMDTSMFMFTGAAQQYVVPAGVAELLIESWGAQGADATIGGTGGNGGFATGLLSVTPGEIITVNVGGQNGFNGGGAGGTNGNTVFGGAPQGDTGGTGGGASDVRQGGAGLANRVLVAGGGGGAGHNGVWPSCQVSGPGGNGGDGGGLTGSTGTNGVGTPCNCAGGGGGTGSAGDQIGGGGAGVYAGNTACLRASWMIGGSGSLGLGGNGSTAFHNGTGGGGGGGGGYFGGGSGANGSDTTPGGGGGGGSSYVGGVTAGSTVPGVQMGDGLVRIIAIRTPGAIQIAGLPSGSAFPLGITTNTWAITDSAGNISECSWTVTVLDTVAPEIQCPADIVATTSMDTTGNCETVVDLTLPIVSDNCPIEQFNVSYTNPDGSIEGPQDLTTLFIINGDSIVPRSYALGITTVSFYVADASGNFDTCSYTVTVTDDEAPVFVNCPADTLVFAGDPDLCGAFVNWSTPIAEDNCAMDTVIETTGLNGTELGIGFHTVSYTATDAAGNDTTCTFVIEVTDTQIPLLTCPSTVIRDADSMCVWVAPMDHLSPLNDFDNCPVDVAYFLISEAGDTLGMGMDDASGETFQLGSTQVCYVATENTDPDGNGMLSDTCCFWVIVEDVLPPIFECPADTIIYAPDSACVALYIYTGPEVADSCNVDGTASIGGPFNFTTAGALGRTGPTQAQIDAAYAGSELDGNVIITTQGIQEWVVPATGLYRIEARGAQGGNDLYIPGPSSGGLGASLSGEFNLTAGQVLNVLVGQRGEDTRSVSEDNAAAGGGGGTFVWDVASTANPLIAAGGGGGAGNPDVYAGIDASLTTNGNDAQGLTNGGMAGNGGRNNLGGMNFSYWAGGGSGWLTDGTGGQNATDYSFTGAAFGGANGGRTPLNGGVGGLRYNDGIDEGGDGGFGGGGGGGSDNMGSGGGGGYSGGGGANGDGSPDFDGGGGGSFNAGTNPTGTVDNMGDGLVIITPLMVSDLMTEQTSGLPSGSSYPVGTTLNTFVATDAAGNMASCSWTVTVLDTVAPELTCASDTTVMASLDTSGNCGYVLELPIPDASDNCPITQFSVVYTNPNGSQEGPQDVASLFAITGDSIAFRFFEIGTTNVLFYAADGSGNSDTCSYNVTVTADTANAMFSPNQTSICAGNGAGSPGGGPIQLNPVMEGGVWTVDGYEIGCTAPDCPYPYTQFMLGGSAASPTLDIMGANTVGSYLLCYSFPVSDSTCEAAMHCVSILVIDDVNPTIQNDTICPSNYNMTNMFVTNAQGGTTEGGDFAIIGGSGATAMGLTVPFLIGGDEFEFTEFGTYNIRYTVGTQNSCEEESFALLIVEDTEAPAFVNCPTDTLVFAGDPDLCGANVNWSTPVAEDNCAMDTVIETTGLNGTELGIGFHTVSYTATDVAGNDTTCTFVIEVLDTQVPLLTCPGNQITAEADSNCQWIAPAGILSLLNDFDNCPVAVTYELFDTAGMSVGTGMDDASLDTFELGTTQVCYYAIETSDPDNNGMLTDTCCFLVVVVDVTVPEIVCPADTVVVADLDTCGAVVEFEMPEFSDNCSALGVMGADSLTFTGAVEQYVIPDDVFEITIEARGAAGGGGIAGPGGSGAQITGTFAVTPGQILNVVVGQQGGEPIPPTSPQASSGGGGGSFIYDAGNNLLIAAGGGGGRCNYLQGDPLHPEADGQVGPDGGIQGTFSGGFNFVPGTPGMGGNGGVGGLVFGSASSGGGAGWLSDGAPLPFGGSGLPTWAGGTEVNTSGAPGGLGGFGGGGGGGAWFGGGGGGGGYSGGAGGDDPDHGGGGGSFNAGMDPMNVGGIQMGDGLVIIRYAIEGGSIEQIAGLGSGSFFPVGTTENIFRATDESGNQSTCSFTVTVLDEQDPMIDCPVDTAIMTSAGDFGNCVAQLSWPHPIGMDNCEITDYSVLFTDADGAIDGPYDVRSLLQSYEDTIMTRNFGVGVSTVEYLVSDLAGNIATCSFTVTVTDDEAPIFVNCPTDTLVFGSNVDLCATNVNWSTPVATDNCAMDTVIETTGLNGTDLPIGFHTISYEATDEAGNVSTCTFMVEIIDTQIPLLTCPGNFLERETDPDLCSWTAPEGTLSVLNDFDNCPIDVTYYLISTAGDTLATGMDDASGETFELDSTQVCYVATESDDPDNNGVLSDTCCFWVIVSDTQVPEIFCPGDTIIYASDTACLALYDYEVTGTDNCDGVLSAVGGDTTTFMFTGATQQYVVPAGVTEVMIEALGAQGGAGNNVRGGLGGYASGLLTVTPGEVLEIYVGESPVGLAGGFNGGGSTGSGSPHGAGGGASDVRQGGSTLMDRVIVAGGGGGTCLAGFEGGAGGGLTGDDATADLSIDNGAGGTSSTGGIGSMANSCCLAGDFGLGGSDCGNTRCSGGGGGWYGGGSGCGGGGGSSYIGGVAGGMTTTGVQMGNGLVRIITMGTQQLVQTAGLPSGSFFPLGETVNTWTATDASGNVSECSWTVTVVDSTTPVLECPADVVAFTADGSCDTLIELDLPVVTDNCPIGEFLVTFSNPDGTVDGPQNLGDFFLIGSGADSIVPRNFEVGVTIVTYYAADVSGNADTCTYTVTVLDNVDPVFVNCPTDTLVFGSNVDLCATNVNWSTPVATDNCAMDTVIETTGLNGTDLPIGFHTITYEATDEAGNVSTCTFVVEIIDTQIPLLTCPGNFLERETDPDLCSWTAPEGTLSVLNDFDNCPVDVTYYLISTAGDTLATGMDDASGETFELDSTQVCYIATESDDPDNNGVLSDTCCFWVIVSDVQVPEIFCPGDTIIYASDTACNALYEYEVTAFDNCDGDLSILGGDGDTTTFMFTGAPQQYVVPSGVTEILIEAWGAQGGDGNFGFFAEGGPGGFASGLLAVTPGEVLEIYVGGEGETRAITTVGGGGFNGGGDSQARSGETRGAGGGASDVRQGGNTLVDRVLVAAGGGGSCGTSGGGVGGGLIGQDGFDTGFNENGLGGTQSAGGSSNVSGFVITPSGFGLGGSTDACCTASGGGGGWYGGGAGCAAGGGSSYIGGVTGGMTTAGAQMGNGMVRIIAMSPALIQTAGLPSGSFFPLGETVNTWTATDASGNVSECSWTVTVVDTTTPVLECPADVVAFTADGSCDTLIELDLPVVTDNCPIGEFLVTFSNPDGTVDGPQNLGDFFSIGSGADSIVPRNFGVGVTTVTYYAADISGNADTCTYTVIVIDNVAPRFVNCPDTLTVGVDPFLCEILPIWSAPVATDNCALDTVVQTAGPTPGTELSPGLYTVTYTATDTAGNTTSCTFTLEIIQIDEVDASTEDFKSCARYNQQTDLTQSFIVGTTTPGGRFEWVGGAAPGTGGTGSDASVVSGDVLVAQDSGTYVIYYIVGDTASDVSCADTSMFTVLVDSPPVLTCPDDVEVENDPGACGALVEYDMPTFSDICPDGLISVGGSSNAGNMLSITNAADTVAATGFGCGFSNSQVENSYYSLIDLSGYSDDFELTNVRFKSSGFTVGTQSIDARVYIVSDVSMECSIPFSDLTAIASGSITYGPAAQNDDIVIPMSATIPASSFVLVELNVLPSSDSGWPLGANFNGFVSGTTWNSSTVGSCGFSSTSVDCFPSQDPPTIITFLDGSLSAEGPVEQIAGLPSGSIFPVGVTENVFLITDSCGYSDTCSFTVTVLDTETPMITCPDDVGPLTTADGSCDTIYSWTHPSPTDNCGLEGYTVTYTNPDGTIEGPMDIFTGVLQLTEMGVIDSMLPASRRFTVGTTTIDYLVYDAAGNSAECSFTVTVADEVAPEFVNCPDTLTVGVDPFLCEILPIWNTPVATDNCEMDTVQQIAGPRPGTELSPGIYSVTYLATDIAGNQTLCTFVLEVIQIDEVDASTQDFASCEGINRQTDLTQAFIVGTTTPGGRFEWVGGAAPGTGGTGSATSIVSGDVLVADEIGTYVVYYIVGDTATEESCADSSMFTVTIDESLPTITGVANDTTVACGDSIPAVVDPVIDDNCLLVDVSFFETIDTLDCANSFVITRNWIVTDGAGNSASASQTITVLDEEAPIPSPAMFADTTVGCGDSIPAVPVVDWVDNCGDEVNVDFSETLDSLTGINDFQITRTWIGTDLCGNSDTVVQIVIVEDVSNPTITCPQDVGPLSTADGSCDTLYEWTHPTPEDGCGFEAYSVSYTNPDGSIDGAFDIFADLQSGNLAASRNFEIGTTTVSYVVVDQSGNTAGCSFTVTVVDDVNPIFVTCPDSIIIATNADDCDATVTYSLPTVDDNCGVDSVILTQGLTSGAIFPLGDTYVEWVAYDAAGNTDTCGFLVTVLDNDMPTAVCQDLVIYLDENGSASITPEDVDGGSTENCSPITLSIDLANFGCEGAPGVAGDPVDLVISGAFDATLSGGLPKGIELYAAIDIPDLGIYGIGSANNGGGTDGEEFSFPSVFVPAGSYIYVVSEEMSFTTWFGSTPSFLYSTTAMLINGDDAVELFKNGSVLDVFGDVNTDGSGQVWDYLDSWAYRVNSTGPDASFMPGNWTFAGANEWDGEADNASSATPMPIGTHVFVPGMSIPPMGGLGENNVTLTVTDEHGNSAVCVAEVTVLDTIAPTFTCPFSDVDNAINVPGCDAIMPDLVSLVTDAEDNCSVVSIVQTPLAGVSLSDEVGNVVLAEVTVTDQSGNETTCIVEITVVDIEDPFFQNCPGPLTFGTDPDQCGALVNWAAPVAFDNCDEELDVTQIAGPISGDFLEVDSTYTVTYMAEDADGNSATCTFTIEVLDTECPDFVTTLPLDEVVTCDAIPEPFELNPAWHTVDNCTPSEEVVDSFSQDTFDILCANTYTLKRTWWISDASGNQCFHIQKLFVIDTVAPVFDEAPDITISSEDSGHPDNTGYPDNIFDNCSEEVDTIFPDGFLGIIHGLSTVPGITMEFSDDSTQCDDQSMCCFYTYTITRTWVLTDECANSSSDVQIIEVEDVTRPTAICQDITVYLDENGEVIISSNDVNDGSFDNAAEEEFLTFSISKNRFTCDNIGDNDVILTVVDPCGNEGICASVVTVLDTLVPVLECPANITITLDPGECETIQHFEPDVLTDNCDIDSFSITPNGIPFPIGVTEITIVAIDEGGNEVSCSFNLTVEEYPNPTGALACNDQINLSLDADCEGEVLPDMILEGGPYACYDCYVVTLHEEDGAPPIPTSPFVTSENVGDTLIAMVTDTCGGGNICWGYVFVENKLFPEVICPADTLLPCNALSDPSITGFPIPTSCPGPGDFTVDYSDVIVDNDRCDDPRVEITRTWTITDVSGNSTVCEQRIVLQTFDVSQVTFPDDYDDFDNPAFTCAEVSADPSLIEPGNTGFPMIDGIEIVPNDIPFCDLTFANWDKILTGCGNSYEIQRTWSVSNLCQELSDDNPIEFTQRIIVWDDADPVISNISDVTVSTLTDECVGVWNVTIPQVEDCSGYEFNVSYTAGNLVQLGTDQYILTDIPVGETEVTYIIIDECFNIATRTITVTVIDNQAPTAVCDENTVVSVTIDGTGLAYAETFDDGSHDNCKDVWFKVIKTDELCGTTDGFDGTFNVCVTCDGLNANDGDDDPIKIGTQVYFDDYVRFCCDEVGNRVGVTMRVFEVDPGEGPIDPARMRPGGDLYGTYNDCDLETLVQDELPPVVLCPPSITVSCDFEYDPFAITDPADRTFGAVVLDGEIRGDVVVSGHGNPNFPGDHVWGIDGVFGDNCTAEIDIDVSINIECGRGTLTRMFTATDAGGRTATCQQVITFEEFDPFIITDLVCPGEPGWSNSDNVDWPCDVTLEDVCTEDLMDDPSVTGEPIIYGDVCADILVNYEDELFVNDPDACIKILRTWKILDWCQYDEITGAGQWIYTQVIKLSNSIGPEMTGELELVSCDSTSSNCEGYIDLVMSATDDCSAEVDISYFIDAFNDGDIDVAAPGDDASGFYPFGDHTITWRAVDGCGNLTELTQAFSVQDCKKPSPKCFSGLITVIMESVGEVTIWASDFDAGSDDNCGDVTVSFSEDVDDQFITFNCEQLGTQTVQLWVTDAAGNQDFCETFIFIQDNNDACNGISGDVGGLVITEDEEGIEDVEISLDILPATPYQTTMTEDDGTYVFEDVLLTEDYELGGFKNDDPMNGVSTFDIVKIQKHLLGLEPFDVAYKYLAADINNNEGVTALDMVELRRLLLGEYDEFPDNTSWRFVDITQEWDDITDPWPFEEIIDVTDLTTDDLDNNFIGVKVGDLTGNASPNGLMGTEDRTPDGSLVLAMMDAKVSQGDQLRLEILASDFRQMLGYQMTWNLAGLDYEGIEAGAIDIAAGNIGTRRSDQGIVTMSWSEGEAVSIADEEVLFTLLLTATETGRMSEMLSLSSEITTIEAYSEESINLDVALAWRTEERVQDFNWTLEQNTPNPFDEETMIEFRLAKASDVNISITDAKGSTVKVIEGEYAAGIHQIKLKRSDLNAGGVYIYELSATPQDGSDAWSGVKKMIVLD